MSSTEIFVLLKCRKTEDNEEAQNKDIRGYVLLEHGRQKGNKTAKESPVWYENNLADTLP